MDWWDPFPATPAYQCCERQIELEQNPPYGPSGKTGLVLLNRRLQVLVEVPIRFYCAGWRGDPECVGTFEVHATAEPYQKNPANGRFEVAPATSSVTRNHVSGQCVFGEYRRYNGRVRVLYDATYPTDEDIMGKLSLRLRVDPLLGKGTFDYTYSVLVVTDGEFAVVRDEELRRHNP